MCAYKYVCVWMGACRWGLVIPMGMLMGDHGSSHKKLFRRPERLAKPQEASYFTATVRAIEVQDI